MHRRFPFLIIEEKHRIFRRHLTTAVVFRKGNTQGVAARGEYGQRAGHKRFLVQFKSEFTGKQRDTR